MRRLSSSADYVEAKRCLYSLAHVVCVNGEEQAALVDTLRDIERAGIREGLAGSSVIASMTNVIFVGLTYGNWPWIKDGINTLERN